MTTIFTIPVNKLKKHKNRRDLIEKYDFQKIYDDYMKNNNK